MDFNELISAIHLGFLFGVMFLSVLIVIVSYSRGLPKKNLQKNSSGKIKVIAMLGILFFATAIVVGMAIIGYFVSAQSNSMNVELKSNIEQNLQDSLAEVEYLSQKPYVNSDELLYLQYQLEDALKRLQEQKSHKRIIAVIPGTNY